MNKTLARDYARAWSGDDRDAVTVINQDIDRLMARLPALPAWAAHQICGWDWLAKTTLESRVSYIKEARAESKYSHNEEAHNR